VTVIGKREGVGACATVVLLGLLDGSSDDRLRRRRAPDPNAMSSVIDRTDNVGSNPRPLDQIFPLRGDATRGREMQATWRSFCGDRLDAVKAVLAAGRSPPEIAYQLGELLHNHFRTRGVTLTSYELRQLVAELLALHGPEPKDEPPPPVPKPQAPERKESSGHPQPVVAFDREPPPGQPWLGDIPAAPAPTVPDKALEPPPSPIVSLAPRQAAPFARLLAETVDLAKGRLAPSDREAVRTAIDEAVSALAQEQELPPAARQRLAAAALSEVAGLGVIDRLWADPTVRAVFVNGPKSVFVERDGVQQAAAETFRDEAHLLELVTRLVGRPASGMADFELRDGSSGFVILPPAAPGGPVLTVRRAEPGQATLERLISSGLLDKRVAELLRLGARSRLNMLITGPSGCGKTAVLAALVRDLDAGQRVVTVAAHRQFAWPMPSKVELLAASPAALSALIAAGARMEPGLLVLDGVQLEDVAALSERLLRGASGTLAAVRPEVMSPALGRSADLVVHLDRGADGMFGVVSVEDSARAPVFGGKAVPAFAGILRERGFGDALADLLSEDSAHPARS
jgi:Flp pilus assembly CpaF family ATPase